MTSESEPLWRRHAPAMPRLPPPDDVGTNAEIVVIGAGIAGVSVALALAEAGRRVLVLEKTAIGAGQTGRTSAHLASALDDRFHRLERWHGRAGARAAAETHAAAIDRIERWTLRYRIDCDFARIDGYLVATPDAAGDELAREHDAAQRAGLDVDRVGSAPALEQLGPALRFARQARFSPVAYLAGLAHAAASHGVAFACANATRVQGGRQPRVHVDGGASIEADAVVVATNVPFHESLAIHTRQAPYRTYMLAVPIDIAAFPDILLWDTGDPYHYLRRWQDPRDGSTWLLVGGADHKTGQQDADEPYATLGAWMRERIGGLGDIEWRWSGQVLEPVDGLAFIGEDPGGEENVYVVTGDSGNGLTHGTIAADAIPSLIDKRVDARFAIYDPRRSPTRAFGAWLRENANVAAQYRDWVANGRTRPLGCDDATIVRSGLHRLAVYRAADGTLSAFSALCPHLGCSVRWNAIERTWDCPCHGSRFDPIDGRVLNGPAARGLSKADVPQ